MLLTVDNRDEGFNGPGRVTVVTILPKVVCLLPAISSDLLTITPSIAGRQYTGGNSMQVSADQGLCVAAGICVATAPEVFDQRDSDGKVVVLDGRPAPHLHKAALEAAEYCPAFAITVTSNETGG
jgi:ferredoxin